MFHFRLFAAWLLFVTMGLPSLSAQVKPNSRPAKPLLYHVARGKIQKFVTDNDAKSAKSLLLMLEKAVRTSDAMLKRITLIQTGDPKGIAPPATQAQAKRQRNDLINHLERVEAYWQWQVVVNDLQEAVAQMTTLEATDVYLKRLPQLRPQAQVVLLMGLQFHKPNETTTAEVVKLMGKTRESEVRVACMHVLMRQGVRAAQEEVLKYLSVKGPIAEQITVCRYLALMNDPQMSVAPLIKYLDSGARVRCQYEANAALRMLTGQKYHPHNANHWRAWWKENGTAFEPRPTAEIEILFNYEMFADKDAEAKEAEANAEAGGEDLYYYNIPFVTDRVVFILDMSESMNQVVTGGKSRLDEAREMLKKLILALPEDTEYGILLYNHRAARWPSRDWTAKATKANKLSSTRFLDSARPAGSTATLAALEAVIRHMTSKAEIDTVFLLTDGEPNPMFIASYYKDPNQPITPNTAIEMVKRVRFINQTRKVRINTIGTGEAPSAFLQVISKTNDGKFMKTSD